MHKQKTSDKILFFLKTRGPQTAKTLSEHFGMTTMGIRQHVLQLEQSELLNSFDRNEKVGRPSRYWQLTDKANQQFPDRHNDLTLSLIDNVRDVFGETGLDKLIDQREKLTLAHYQASLKPYRSLLGKLNKLVEIRSSEGYMAELGRDDEGNWLLIENHCPICAAANQCQSFCRSELNIFASCLQAEVTRQEYILDGGRRCCYRIIPFKK